MHTLKVSDAFFHPASYTLWRNFRSFYLKEKNLSFLFIAMVIFLASFPLRGEAKVILTWDDCTKLLRERNIDLQSATHSLEAFRYAEKQSYAGFLPEVSAGISLSNNKAKERYQNTSLSITQRFFSGFADSANVMMKKYDRQNSELDLASAKVELTYSLRAALAKIIYANEFLKVSQGIVERRANNFKKVELLFENGKENRGTYLLLQGLLHRAQIEYEEIKDLRIWAAKDLASLLGIDISEEIELDPSLTLSSLVDEKERSELLDLYKQAEKDKKLSFDLIAASFDYKKSLNNELSSQMVVHSSRSAFFPTLSLTQEYSRSNDYVNDPRNSWTFSVAVNIPIFNGGQNFFDTQVAIEKRTLATLARRKSELDIEKTLLEALKELNRKSEKIKVEKELLEAYELSDRVATEQYFNSFISFRDWNWAYTDLVDQQLNYFAIQNDLVMQQALVERLKGKNLLDK